MNEKEFITWLNGMVDAINSSTTRELTVEQWDLIKSNLNKLKEVKNIGLKPEPKTPIPWDKFGKNPIIGDMDIQLYNNRCGCKGSVLTCSNPSCPYKITITYVAKQLIEG